MKRDFLSLAAWQLMSAIWDLGGAEASEVARVVRAKFGRTITAKAASIMLSRLADRGLLRSELAPPNRRGRPAFVYSPVVPRHLALEAQFRRFVQEHGIQAEDFPVLQGVVLSPAPRKVVR